MSGRFDCFDRIEFWPSKQFESVFMVPRRPAVPVADGHAAAPVDRLSPGDRAKGHSVDSARSTNQVV